LIISDVAGLDYVFGGSAACFEREQCFIGYTSPDVYNITFADVVTLEFKVLEDDLGLHPAQNIAPIINSEVLAAYGADLSVLLNELSAVITTADLVAWNTETDIELRESDAVATEWLESEGLI